MFFAIGDEEVVVGVEIADVAGVKPAFLVDDFTRGVRTFVITLHHARTFGEDFAVFRYANENVGNGSPGAAAAILRIIGGEDRRSLRQAVALVNGNADGPEKFSEFLGERRTAGENHAQFSACSGADFFVDEFVGESPLSLEKRAGTLGSGAPGSGAPGDVDRPIKQGAFDSGGFASLLHQLRVNLLEETPHGREYRRMNFE